MAFVGEERGLVEGWGSKSFVVGVGGRAVWIPFFAKMRIAFRLLVGLLLLPLPALFLSLVTIIIGTVYNKVTSLTAFEAGIRAWGNKMSSPYACMVVQWLLGALPGPMAFLSTVKTRWAALLTISLASWVVTDAIISWSSCRLTTYRDMLVAPFKKATRTSSLHKQMQTNKNKDEPKSAICKTFPIIVPRVYQGTKKDDTTGWETGSQDTRCMSDHLNFCIQL